MQINKSSIVKILILLVLVGVVYKLAFTKKSDGKLVIYAYSSFAASWGAGPEIVHLFQEKEKTKVELIDVGSANQILQRLELEGEETRADVVIGLDQISSQKALSKFDWRSKQRVDFKPLTKFIEEKYNESPFYLIDWSPMTFLYYSLRAKPVGNLKGLLGKKYVLYRPRTSSPGMQLLNWAYNIDPSGGLVKELKKGSFRTPNTWSEGYGMFKKGQVDYAFTYLSSLIYHWVNKNDSNYQPAIIDEPLPYQLEYAGILDSTNDPDLAKKFIKFLYEKRIQKIIMEKNFMLPVVSGVIDGTAFEKLPKVKLMDMKTFGEDVLLKNWD